MLKYNLIFHTLELSDVVFILHILYIYMLNANNCRHFNIYQQNKFHAHAAEHEKSFITSTPE